MAGRYNMVKLSIITPCFNGAKYIEKLIRSVQAQTFQDWEHIVVDDGSTDGSAAIVEKFAKKDPRITLIRQANAGVCRARNNGYKHAIKSSPYVHFLDADDVLEPDMLKVLITHLKRHPEAGLAYCDFIYIDAHDRPLETPPHRRFVDSRWGARLLPYHQPKTPFMSFYCLAPAPGSITIFRREIFEKVGGWDESFGQHHEDVDLFLRVCLVAEAHFVAKKLYRYRQHSAQSTARAEALKNSRTEALYQKWDDLPLSLKHRRIVEKAKHFRLNVLPWAKDFTYAEEYWRQGRKVRALRALGGALARGTLKKYKILTEIGRQREEMLVN